MGKGTVLLSTSEDTPSSERQFDGKSKFIIILSCLLLCAVIIIIILLCAVIIIQYYYGYKSMEDKPSYWISDDPRFGSLIFDEEFSSLNLSRWQHEITLAGGGNWEFEYYQNNRSNSYVRNGILYIKPTLTNDTFTAPGFLNSGTIDLWGGDPADQCTDNGFYGCSRTGSASNALNAVQSARLRSVNSFNFNYGRIEIRAQLPRGDWLWPAIWLLPQQNYYNQWPASGEIDIIESRGNDKLNAGSASGPDIGSNQMGTTVHWGPYYGADMYSLTTKSYSLPNGELFSAAFHNWTLDWTPDGFNCSVDGNLYFTVETGDGYWIKGNFDTNKPGSNNPWQYGAKDAPFDKPFYFVLNVAAGGTNGYFPTGSVSSPQGLPSYTQPWPDDSQVAYQQFWSSVHQWYPTWHPFENNGEAAAMKIDYIRVYQYVANK